MTKNTVGRLLLVLSGLDISVSELQNFFRWVERRGAGRVSADIERMREFANKVEVLPAGEPTFSQPPVSQGPISSDKDILRRIEKILLSETGLTRSRATALFYERLVSDGIPMKDIPDPAKTSFINWLTKLGRRVPPIELLRVASLLRNDLVHGQMAWPLRRES
jgi:hypothetical protein